MELDHSQYRSVKLCRHFTRCMQVSGGAVGFRGPTFKGTGREKKGGVEEGGDEKKGCHGYPTCHG